MKATIPKKNRRQQILDAAAREFSEKGYDRATLREIADTVGITKASLYHHFRGKHDLLFEIIHTLIEKDVRQLRAIAALTLPADEKIHLAFREHFSSYKSKFPHYGVLLHEKTDALPPHQEQIIKGLFRDFIGTWAQIIEEGIAKGALRSDLDAKVTMWAAVGMSNWVYKWSSPEGRLGIDKIAEIVEEIFLHGVVRKA